MREIHFDNVLEFLDHLSPLNLEESPLYSIYRGQGDAEFQLIPSAYRQYREQAIASYSSYSSALTPRHQALYEYSMISQFLRACDQSGLALAGDSVAAREDLDQVTGDLENWPPKSLWQILAVAQHHGIPTRLLDWTQRAYVAAYFAVTQAISLNYRPERIAVWALIENFSHRSDGVSIVRLPGATSVNLAAQAGVFTLAQPGEDPKAPMSFRCLSELAADHTTLSLAKYTLPFSAVPLLYDSLVRLAVTGALLFPGFDGVAKDVRNRALMRKLELGTSRADFD